MYPIIHPSWAKKKNNIHQRLGVKSNQILFMQLEQKEKRTSNIRKTLCADAKDKIKVYMEPFIDNQIDNSF